MKDRLQAITTRAENETRDLYPDETRQFDQIAKDYEQFPAEFERRFGAPLYTERQIMPIIDGPPRKLGDKLGPEHRMADWAMEHSSREELELVEEGRDFSLGRYVRGMVTGNWAGAEFEKRALAEGTLSAGGYLVPTPLAAFVIDRIRPANRVLQAGARVVPMDSETLSVARLSGDPTPAWKSENAAVAVSDHAFERVMLSLNTLAVIVKISYELFQDMSDAGAGTIENSIVQALAQELDRAALYGAGTPPEPQGVINQSAVTILTNGANGTAMSYDMLVAAAAQVRANNFEPNAAILNPRATKSLAGLKDTLGQYVRPPAYTDAMAVLTTTKIPTTTTTGSSSDTSDLFVAQWDQLFIGIRSTLGISLTQGAVGGSLSGAPGAQLLKTDMRYIDTMQVGVLCYLRADVQVAHPLAFVVSRGIRP